MSILSVILNVSQNLIYLRMISQEFEKKIARTQIHHLRWKMAHLLNKANPWSYSRGHFLAHKGHSGLDERARNHQYSSIYTEILAQPAKSRSPIMSENKIFKEFRKQESEFFEYVWGYEYEHIFTNRVLLPIKHIL